MSAKNINLTVKQEAFAQEFAISGDASKAYRVAYNADKMTSNTLWVKAHDVRHNDKVAIRIEELQNTLKEKSILKSLDIFKVWEKVALADIGEIIKTVQTNCQECYYDPEAERKIRIINRDPNPACDACQGEGISTVKITPTDQLSPTAKLLYKGCKQGKNGIELIFRDQDAALANIARCIGMFDGKTEESKKDLTVAPIMPSDPQEAASVYQRYIQGK